MVMDVRLTVVTSLQYIQIPNYYVAHLELMSYVNYTSIKSKQTTISYYLSNVIR